MRVKKYLGIAISIGMAVCITGCGEKFPELTDQQYAQTVEYAAGLLMKHSNNGQERLVYVDAAALEKQRAKEAAAAAEAEKEQEKEQTPPAVETTPAVVETQPEATDAQQGGQEEAPLTTEAEPAPGAEETPAEPAAEEIPETAQTNPSDDAGAITISDEESQEIAENIFLSYQGYMVSSTYPESSKSYVVNADKGKKLLVLRFDLYNASDSSKTVNIIPMNPHFEIILNGKNLGYSSVTFLPNDLSTYSGTIDSRAHESVVVLIQISSDDAKNIESLGMIVTMKGNSQKVNLK